MLNNPQGNRELKKSYDTNPNTEIKIEKKLLNETKMEGEF